MRVRISPEAPSLQQQRGRQVRKCWTLDPALSGSIPDASTFTAVIIVLNYSKTDK